MSNIEEQIHPALRDAQMYIEQFTDENRHRAVGQDGFRATRTIGQAFSIAVMAHTSELETVLAETLFALGYQKGIETAAKAFQTSKADGMMKAFANAVLSRLSIKNEPK